MQTLSTPPQALVTLRAATSRNGIVPFLDRIIHYDSLKVMQAMPAASIDLIVTDPPYLVAYKDRDGRSIANDQPGETRWLFDSSQEMYRVLKDNSFCVSFYGRPQAGAFHNAWAKAGFRVVGNFVWAKPYTSSTGYTQRRHECAALLVKGNPRKPSFALPDVLTGRYTGNRLHPTQKPVDLLAKFIRSYSRPGEIVLDPFAGSGSTAVAAKHALARLRKHRFQGQLKRHFVAIELLEQYAKAASKRLHAFRLA